MVGILDTFIGSKLKAEGSKQKTIHRLYNIHRLRRFPQIIKNKTKHISLAGSGRKTTRLRFGKLRRGRQVKTPGGPVFALTSYASAGGSGRKTTSPFNRF
jgi:hypothetical protein